MKPATLWIKILVLASSLFTISSFINTAHAAGSNSFVCGSGQNGALICDTSYSQQSWKGSNECYATFIKNEAGTISCEEIKKQCATGNLPNIMNSINEIFSGVTRVDADAICNAANTSGGKVDPKIIAENISFEDGLTSTLLDGTGFMYQTPPIEPFRIYAKKNLDEALAKLDFLDTANAQNDEETFYFPGPGYNLLGPIKSIWNAMRNVAYGFMIIIVFFISLMILFRRQLNGQQTVNLVNSIPSLFASALLITFSYGISGVFLDIIPIGSNFIQYVLVGNPASPGYNSIWNSTLIRTNSNLIFYTGETNTDGTIVPEKLEEWLGIDINTDVIDPDAIAPGKHAIQIDDEYMSIWQIWGTANPSIFNTLNDGTNNFNIIPDAGVLRNSGVIQQVASSFGGLLGTNQQDSDSGTIEATAGVVQNAAGILIDLVFSFAALVATFKLFMSLLRAYLTLILLPAVSPLIFLLAGIPSLTSNMIGLFVKTMLGSALSFVGVYAAFLIVIILAYEQFVQNSTFIPPLLGYTEQANINVNGSIIKSLAAYGIFLMTPIIPQKIQDALQSGGDNAFGEAVTQGTQQGLAYTMMLGNAINQQFKKMVSPKDA